MADDKIHIVTEAATRILADLADPQTINRADNDAWKEPLWQALNAAGLPLAWVPERLGGSGATLTDGFAILSVAGRFALAAPLAETLAAGWLLARGDLAAPPTRMTLAPVRPRDRIVIDADGKLNGRATGVPFARRVSNTSPCSQPMANSNTSHWWKRHNAGSAMPAILPAIRRMSSPSSASCRYAPRRRRAASIKPR